ncbi:DUF4352 domain-containing protein [Streptomyces thermoalcalitolerans]|uniref:DUF4352 domain-containing protein n=1 Tax=Streptomyces thermoalcalitolerans TaxID=65605 RepID=A0ABP3YWE5_9ACTN
MSQQHPYQPYPPQQPQPGYGHPAPQPPKKRSVGKIVGLGCLGIVGLFVLLGAVGAVIGGGDSGDSKGTSAVAEKTPGDKTEDSGQKAPADNKPGKEKEEAASEGPVKITAKKTDFSKSILASSSDYTSVLITITNNGDEPIDVNPLYFTITDTNGTKHTAELGVDEQQIDTVELAPGENITGTVTGKGTFTAKYVTYTDGFLGDPVRADVS